MNQIPKIHGLVHQAQPTNKTCVQTCIAMAIGVPVNDVIVRYGGEGLHHDTLLRALTECGVVWNQLVHNRIFFPGWYFAAVPSLNHRGVFHQILMHWTPDTGTQVLDPAVGDRYKHDGTDLISWECPIPFIPGGKLPL